MSGNTDKVRIAFVFQVPSFWSSWESLYEACMQDDRIEARIFWLHGANGDWFQMYMSEDYLKNENMPYTRFTYDAIMDFSPQYMVYQTPYDKGHRPDMAWTARFRRKGIKIVYIPYGIEISDMKESRVKHFGRSVVLNSFAVYTLSEAMKEEYNKWCINAEAVRGLGLPKFDGLQKSFSLPQEIRDRAAGRRILLWKVHFPKTFKEGDVSYQVTPNIEEYLTFAVWLSAQTDLFVIFMPHPKFMDLNTFKGKRMVGERLIHSLKTNPNVYIDLSDDYRVSLMNADAIIVDRSAIMVEAGMRDVPTLYMQNEKFEEPMTPPIDRLLNSYKKGTYAEDMIAFYKDVVAGRDEKKSEREAAFNEVVMHDGRCGERIKEDLVARAFQKWPARIPPRFKRSDNVIYFGTGNLFTYFLKQVQSVGDESRANVLGVADNDKDKWDTKVFNVPVIRPADIPNMDYRYVVITSEDHYREIYLQLVEELHVPREQIISYDEFIVMMKYE